MHIVEKDSAEAEAKSLAGQKGFGLWRMTRAGISVPPWVVLGADVFDAFARASDLGSKIDSLLHDLSSAKADLVSKEIAARIAEAPCPLEILELVQRALDTVGPGPLAVRSSGIEEDRPDSSFAGQFDTFLNVGGRDKIVDCIRRCWSSVFSERSLIYRQQLGIQGETPRIAVVLQQMVDAQKSGVAFTASPTTGRRDETVISCVLGLGEGLVSGAVDADTIVVDRRTRKIQSVRIGEKLERYERHLDGSGTTSVKVDSSQRAELALSSADVERLLGILDRIDRLTGGGQDIEWAIDSTGRPWILQVRPITGLRLRGSEPLHIWDNSNIIENFPGVTAPLTFTFARYVYFHVFREYCRLLWIPGTTLRDMEPFLWNLLGYFNGRVYYNLINWYRIAGLTPFKKLNREMMEIGMGLDQGLDTRTFMERIEPFCGSRFRRAAIRLANIVRFMWFFLTFRRNVEAFQSHFRCVFRDVDALNFDRMSAEDVFLHYDSFVRDLLPRWGRMIPLEATIGLPYGLLRHLIQRWIPDAPEWFYTKIIGGVVTIESLEPATRLDEIAEMCRARPGLMSRILEESSEVVYQRLKADQEAEILGKIDAYLNDFAYRSVSELKLEEPDLRDRPAIFFDMLKGALRLSAPRSGARANEAEEFLDRRLRGWRRWVLGVVRARVQAAITAREAVRFCRSKAFGTVRRMMKAIGKDLAELGILEQASDVFLLRVEELHGCFDGSLSHAELGPLVAQRRSDFEAYRTLDDPPPRFVTRGLVYWLENINPDRDHAAAGTDAGNELHGIPCSPGVVEDTAVVATAPSEFSGGVLVTYRTDPGWVPVFASASALLIERGSPLTHAAIVARELGIPTIVQIPGLTRRVVTGTRLKVDGHSGSIELLDRANQVEAKE